MDIINLLRETNIPTIFIIVGFLLMFISIGIKPRSKFIKLNTKPIYTGFLSMIFITLGVLIQVIPQIEINKNSSTLSPSLEIAKLKDRAEKYIKEKNYNSAIETLERVLSLSPNDIWTLKKISDSYKYNKQYHSAISSIDEAIKINGKIYALYEKKQKYMDI